MDDMKRNGMADEPALFSISTVAEMTGVNPVTLRAWERRHGLFKPVRKSSGHRLYTQADIDLVTRAVGLLNRGMRIGQVRAALEQAGLENGATNTWRRYVERMIAASIAFDERQLEAVYGEAVSHHSIDVVTENILMPMAKELGRRWESNQGSIAEEHFFGFYLRNKLGARFHHRAQVTDGPRLLLSCLPGDRHETGLLMFALAANDAGYVTIPLGADMPLHELPASAITTGSSAIILSGHLKPEPGLVEHGLTELASRVDVPVFLGGQSSLMVYDEAHAAGLHILGTDIKSSLERVRNIVPLIAGR